MDFYNLRSECQDDLNLCILESRKTYEELIMEFQIEHEILRNIESVLILFEGEDDNFDPNLRREDGFKSLRVALKNGNEKIAIALIKAGADPNDQNRVDWTNLHFCLAFPSRHDYCNVVKALLEAGADPNIQDKRGGQTALHLACKYGYHYYAIKDLIKARADPNVQDEDGWTPLHLCLVFSEYDDCWLAVKDLLEAGANPNIQDKRDQTALHLACEHDYHYYAIKDLLKAGADPIIQDERGQTALHRACNHRRYYMAKDSLAARIDLDDVKDEDWTTTHAHLAFSRRRDCYYVVTALLEAGADPIIQDEDGKTALDYASEREYHDVVTVLETHIQKTRNET